MTAAIFHYPSPPNEVPHLLNRIWKEEDVHHMIWVRRMSSRGNPHTRGLIVSADDVIPLPLEFEIRHLPFEEIEPTLQGFQQEMAHQKWHGVFLNVFLTFLNNNFLNFFLQFWCHGTQFLGFDASVAR